MTWEPFQEILLTGALVNGNGVQVRAPPIAVDGVDPVRLMLAIKNIGTPGGSDSMVVTPLFVDADGTEYIDANTTYGTITITGSSTPENVTVVIPSPGNHLGLKIVGGSSLTVSNGFVVSARVMKIPLWPLE